MGKLLYSLAIIIGALTAGQIVYNKTKNSDSRIQEKTRQIVFLLRNFAFFGLGSITVINAMWVVDLRNISIISVPIIGVGILAIGSVFALFFSALFKHNRKQKGTMYCSGSCSNVGTIGSLVCFAFFGDAGFAYAALYKLFEAPFYYLIMYPTARSFSDAFATPKTSKLVSLLKDPILITYFSSTLIGLVLNLSNIPRFDFMGVINSIFVPLSSFFLISAVGYTMRFGKIRMFIKEVTAMSVIKFILSPAIVVTISLFLGLDRIADGVLFGSLVLLSVMPSGFNSLIPVQLYHLDIDLANSNWIVTTSLLLVVIPIVWFFVG